MHKALIPKYRDIFPIHFYKDKKKNYYNEKKVDSRRP